MLYSTLVTVCKFLSGLPAHLHLAYPLFMPFLPQIPDPFVLLFPFYCLSRCASSTRTPLEVFSQDPCSQSHAIIVISHAIIASVFLPVATADHGNTPPIRAYSLDHSTSELTLGEAIHTHHPATVHTVRVDTVHLAGSGPQTPTLTLGVATGSGG
jgi:hypothetical protein